jgi:hypothetical protein
VNHIAALAPKLRLVLGQHNVPVADPSVLPLLLAAIQAVREGKGTVKPGDPGIAVHKYDGFTFLLLAD